MQVTGVGLLLLKHKLLEKALQLVHQLERLGRIGRKRKVPDCELRVRGHSFFVLTQKIECVRKLSAPTFTFGPSRPRCAVRRR